MTCTTAFMSAKSLLVKSALPDTDYVVNPYTGCEFGCSYCYASFMGKYVGQAVENWGEYVYVKEDAIRIFEKDLQRIIKKGITPSIFLSSVTDPYQFAEKKYGITRGILEIIVKKQYQGKIGILTKSPLVLRDIDLLKRIPQVEVGLTITTTSDAIARHLEVKAPSAGSRLETLKKLHAARIDTYAFIGPLLPHFFVDNESLEILISSIADTGVKSVYIEHLNMKNYIYRILEPFLKEQAYSSASHSYDKTFIKNNKPKMEEKIAVLLDKYGLSLRLNNVIEH